MSGKVPIPSHSLPENEYLFKSDIIPDSNLHSMVKHTYNYVAAGGICLWEYESA